MTFHENLQSMTFIHSKQKKFFDSLSTLFIECNALPDTYISPDIQKSFRSISFFSQNSLENVSFNSPPNNGNWSILFWKNPSRMQNFPFREGQKSKINYILYGLIGRLHFHHHIFCYLDHLNMSPFNGNGNGT